MRFALLGPLVVADDTGNQAALAGPRLRLAAGHCAAQAACFAALPALCITCHRRMQDGVLRWQAKGYPASRDAEAGRTGRPPPEPAVLQPIAA
jgi:hypothetical protein